MLKVSPATRPAVELSEVIWLRSSWVTVSCSSTEELSSTTRAHMTLVIEAG